jgi:hypothetical protein
MEIKDLTNIELSIMFTKLVAEAIERSLISETYFKQINSIARNVGRNALEAEALKRMNGNGGVK